MGLKSGNGCEALGRCLVLTECSLDVSYPPHLITSARNSIAPPPGASSSLVEALGSGTWFGDDIVSRVQVRFLKAQS